MRSKESYAQQLERHKWFCQRASDYLDLLKRNEVCVCCGHSPVNFDHIFPQEYRPNGKVRKGLRGNAHQTLIDFENGGTQFLCRSCNNSKGDSDTCKRHQKYLGIWNYLPKIDDVESFN